MFPAINAWSFADTKDPAEHIARAAAAGFGGVELVLGPDSPLTCDTPPTAFAQLATRATDLNLRISGLATGQFFQTNYASRDPADRQRAFDWTRRMLDRAAAAQAGAILVIPAVVGKVEEPAPRVAYADALRYVGEALHDLRFAAEARGVTIALENVWNRFLLSPVEAADLLDRVNSPYVGWYFDVANVLPYGYPQDWIRTLGGRIARVHVKDYDLARPGPAGFCDLGAGSVDWPAVIEALKAVGYDGPLTYEWKGDPAAACERIRSWCRPQGERV